MRKLLFLSLLILATLPLGAQTLHAIILVDVEAEGFEKPSTLDMERMASLFRDVAEQIDYSFDLRTHTRSEFTAQVIDRDIDALDVEKDDIVVFYYCGHGYNEGKDKWPTLNLKDRHYWLSDILAKLNQHKLKAKMLMCIADCCNREVQGIVLPTMSFNPVSPNNMRRLFTDFEGQRTIIMSSSQRGQYSICNDRVGGFFTNSYFSAIYKHTDNSNDNPTWGAIHEEAKRGTLKLSNGKQEPQFEIIYTADFNPFEE